MMHPRVGYYLPGGATPYTDEQWAAMHRASVLNGRFVPRLPPIPGQAVFRFEGPMDELTQRRIRRLLNGEP